LARFAAANSGYCHKRQFRAPTCVNVNLVHGRRDCENLPLRRHGSCARTWSDLNRSEGSRTYVPASLSTMSAGITDIQCFACLNGVRTYLMNKNRQVRAMRFIRKSKNCVCIPHISCLKYPSRLCLRLAPFGCVPTELLRRLADCVGQSFGTLTIKGGHGDGSHVAVSRFNIEY
jgi:hypothetical protein